MSIGLQAILFDRNIFSEQSAIQNLFQRGLYPKKEVHITSNYLRYRINEPEMFKHMYIYGKKMKKKPRKQIIDFLSSFGFYPIPNGIKIVVGLNS
jgi:hypothetical protein